MSNVVIKNIIRFVILVLVQLLILQNVDIHRNINLFIYPLAILLLPIRTPHWMVLLIAFALGLTIGIPNDTPGDHAAATVLIAFLRPYLLTAMEPKGGYKANQSPNIPDFGISWFFQYASILLFVHLLTLFIIETLSFTFITLWTTLFSYIFSILLIMLVQFIFNTRD